MKRIISGALALILILCVIPAIGTGCSSGKIVGGTPGAKHLLTEDAKSVYDMCYYTADYYAYNYCIPGEMLVASVYPPEDGVADVISAERTRGRRMFNRFTVVKYRGGYSHQSPYVVIDDGYVDAYFYATLG